MENEREEIIKKLRSQLTYPGSDNHLEELAQFIMTDRRRIVEDFADTYRMNSIQKDEAYMLVNACEIEQCINRNLKLAGIEV